MDERYHRPRTRASQTTVTATVTLTVAVIAIVALSFGTPVSASTPVGDDRAQVQVDHQHDYSESLGMEPTSAAQEQAQLSVVSAAIETKSAAVAATVTAATTVTAAAKNIFDDISTVLQSDQRSHFAALIGIIVLAILGGTLVVRNRMDGRSRAERSDHSTGSENFMTDRERVRQLVNDNGGRMKQAEIVDSVEWSKAKVSRLLADLESEDEITKLRLGRENLICLRGQEPQASKSPDGAGSE